MYEFITGPAGSGKTYGVRERVRTSNGKIRLAATTGIAAVNLGDDVSTIHSLLGFFDVDSLRDLFRYGKLQKRLMKLRWKTGIEQIVIDEASMLGGEVLSLIVRGIETSGVQLGITLVGDFCQLSPVREPFAFECAEWEKHFEPSITKLSTMYRQTDPDFLVALNQLRRGDVACVDYFRQHLSAGKAALRAAAFFSKDAKAAIMREASEDSDEAGRTVIYSTNAEADRHNKEKLDALDRRTVSYRASYWGIQRAEWLRHIEGELHLKFGAPVMILANEKEEIAGPPADASFIYVNGDLGKIVGISSEGNPEVHLKRNGEIVEVHNVTRLNLKEIDDVRASELLRSDPAKLHPGWGNEDKDESKWRYEILGGITYMPLRLAWACTCHKSQGLSLDAIQVDVRHPFFKTPGMLYVSLSRVRSAANGGLKIIGSEREFLSACRANPKLSKWF